MALCRRLVDRDYIVYAGYIDEWEANQLRQLKSELNTDHLVAVPLDLRSQEHIDAVVAQAEQQQNCRGILANGALSPMPRPFEHVDIDEAADTFDINILGNLRLFKRAMPLLEQNRGRIVYVGSIVGKVPMTLEMTYASTKHAGEAIMRVARQELKDKGITVAVVNPGVIARTYMAARHQLAAKTYVAAIDGCTPDEVEPLSFDLGNPDTVDLSYQKHEPYYRRFFSALTTNSTLAMQHFSTPESVAGCIVKAFEARKPKANYYVGLDSKTVRLLNWLLPTLLLDDLLAKMGATKPPG